MAADMVWVGKGSLSIKGLATMSLTMFQRLHGQWINTKYIFS